MTVDAIKAAIAGLTDEERASLASWIVEREYDAWDQQMVKDFSPGGRGSRLVEEINRQIDEGSFRPMKEGLVKRQNRS
ncbi:MAG TPA: hypothetical protein VE959_17180 [Bryobacteraceae bacterium]|nr:hypothetical protein [Bryobacteraceae bacterium]